MKQFTQVIGIMAIVLVFGLTPSFAQEMGHGKMGSGQGMGEMGGMGGMHQKKMEELQQHEKMMEGIQDQKQLMVEMKKHMQMMTDMMGSTYCQLGGMSGKSGAMGSGGGMSEHE